MLTVRMSEGCFVREEFLKEAIPDEYSGGYPESLVVTDQARRIRADFSVKWTQVRIPGKKAGHNNSSLTLQDTPVECSEMGTISDDGSHLCFILVPLTNQRHLMEIRQSI